MTIHIFDAIAVNCRRLPKYWKLTKGKSALYSIILISFEFASLPIAIILDIWAWKFKFKGIPVMKYEFIKMNTINKFSKCYPAEISKELPSEIDIKQFYIKIFYSFKKRNYEKLRTDIEFQLQTINLSPKYLCITRHLLESILRTISLMNLHINRAIDLNTRAPINLSNTIISIHLLPLRFGYLFDLKVKNIQLAGIPFIYQDLPRIPLHDKPYPR